MNFNLKCESIFCQRWASKRQLKYNICFRGGLYWLFSTTIFNDYFQRLFSTIIFKHFLWRDRDHRCKSECYRVSLKASIYVSLTFFAGVHRLTPFRRGAVRNGGSRVRIALGATLPLFNYFLTRPKLMPNQKHMNMLIL
jgi:hypothetical protein